MRNPYRFLITDSHWNADFKGHRPENYGQLIVSNCRKVIAKQDILIHMGDVINDRPSELKVILDKIPGAIKILIRGNHDRQSDNWYMNKGFNFVCDQLVLGDILLSHIPQPIPKGIRVNVHGHFHSNSFEKCFACEPHLKEFYDPKVHKLLAMEYTDYKPVILEEFTHDATPKTEIPTQTHADPGMDSA
jgi:calcineurin-like phosphoesterase family protein